MTATRLGEQATAGGAVKRLPAELRDAHPRVPWRQMAGMRDRLIHGYFSVDPGVVYVTVKEELPALLPALEGIRRSLEGREEPGG